MKDLLRTSDLTELDIRLLLNLAAEFRAEPHRRPGTLRDDTVVLYFTTPSTRTRLSFETAVARLGAVPVSVGPNELQLGRGETIEDTARVISAYAAALAVRTSSHDDLCRLAATATIPVINALTDLHHPCQSLADLLTIRDHFGTLSGLRIAYLGDGNNVAHSLLEACATVGTDIALASPPGHHVDPGVEASARELAAERGSKILVTEDADEAVRGAHVVYTDVWLSMGDDPHEVEARRTAFLPYQVNERVMGRAATDAVFLHCLPAHRGEEVTADVIDGECSLVFNQAANRLWTEMGLLYALCRGLLASTEEEREARRMSGAR